jgi:hypothetical protein
LKKVAVAAGAIRDDPRVGVDRHLAGTVGVSGERDHLAAVAEGGIEVAVRRVPGETEGPAPVRASYDRPTLSSTATEKPPREQSWVLTLPRSPKERSR